MAQRCDHAQIVHSETSTHETHGLLGGKKIATTTQEVASQPHILQQTAAPSGVVRTICSHVKANTCNITGADCPFQAVHPNQIDSFPRASRLEAGDTFYFHSDVEVDGKHLPPDIRILVTHVRHHPDPEWISITATTIGANPHSFTFSSGSPIAEQVVIPST